MEPVFLSLDEVLEIHQQQIERYGGSGGLRDAGALESAVATPQATFDGEFLHMSIPAMAAAYLFHLCQNHPFIDGNKRAGANAAVTFLLMNDWEPTFEQEELTDVVLAVASSGLSNSLSRSSNPVANLLKILDSFAVFNLDERGCWKPRFLGSHSWVARVVRCGPEIPPPPVGNQTSAVRLYPNIGCGSLCCAWPGASSQ